MTAVVSRVRCFRKCKDGDLDTISSSSGTNFLVVKERKGKFGGFQRCAVKSGFGNSDPPAVNRSN